MSLRSTAPEQRVRIVVCDPSPMRRRTTLHLLTATDTIDVIGEAATAIEAIDLVRRLRPTILVLDLDLPDLSGPAVLASLADVPVHVVVVDEHERSGDRTVEALACGAVDVLSRPADATAHSGFAARMIESVHALAGGPPPLPRAARRLRPVSDAPRAIHSGPARRLIVIGASTGGPAAVDRLTRALPRDLRAPVIVVQHLPLGFSDAFARRLQRGSELQIREASDGDPLIPGELLVAPCGKHLHVTRDAVHVRPGDRVNGMCPSVDVTLLDAARTWGDAVTAVILTGVGSDGCEGARAIRRAGGRVMAQHRDSCAVWGMPRAVCEEELVDEEVPLEALAERLVEEARR